MNEGRIRLDQHGRKIYQSDGATLSAFLMDRAPVAARSPAMGGDYFEIICETYLCPRYLD